MFQCTGKVTVKKRGVVTNPKHTTIWAAMKMINSLPVRFSTQTKDTQFTKNKQTKTKKKKSVCYAMTTLSPSANLSERFPPPNQIGSFLQYLWLDVFCRPNSALISDTCTNTWQRGLGGTDFLLMFP